jgi:hypothetical protein
VVIGNSTRSIHMTSTIGIALTEVLQVSDSSSHSS